VKDAIPPLLKLFREDPAFLVHSGDALVNLGVSDIVPELTSWLTVGDKAKRRLAIRWLSALRATKAANEIEKLLGDNDTELRYEAAIALCELGQFGNGVELVMDQDSRLGYLNALSHPELWWKLRRTRLTGRLDANGVSLLRSLERTTGLYISCPLGLGSAEFPLLVPYRIRANPFNQVSGLDAIMGLLEGKGYSFIISSDRIEIVGVDRARHHWRGWKEGRYRK
jgi:hypothetical protein